MNVDIEDIASLKKTFWEPIYEVIEIHILQKQNYFRKTF